VLIIPKNWAMYVVPFRPSTLSGIGHSLMSWLFGKCLRDQSHFSGRKWYSALETKVVFLQGSERFRSPTGSGNVLL
jgi:hypothetical protein